METTSIRGLRAARLDRVLDALAGRAPTAAEPRSRRSRPKPDGGVKPPLALRFLSTV
jgi:hypothetical protein